LDTWSKQTQFKPNPNLVLSAACPELAVALSVVEGVVEWVEWANLRKAKMNVNSFIKKGYRKKDDFEVRKNKPNIKRAKMDVNIYSTKDYENEPRLRAPGKQTETNPVLRAACSERSRMGRMGQFQTR